MEVGVPESLKDTDEHRASFSGFQNIELFLRTHTHTRTCGLEDILPVQKPVSSWDPTAAGLSSDGRPQDWRLESASSDCWGHIEASGNSSHSQAYILQTSRSSRRGRHTGNIYGDRSLSSFVLTTFSAC